ncbi:MAG: DUF3048 domain-containing protein [Christensenella sp.]
MKRILTILLTAVMVCGIFTACAKPAEVAPSAKPTVVTAETPAPTEAPTATPDAIPTNVSLTTGLEGNTTYKPIIVQIDNEPPARPQTGVQAADIVYETPIEGADTRLTCLYNDAINSADAPEKLTVGPVRSSRYYHQWIQGEWDAIYVHNGGPDATAHEETDIWGESAEHIKLRVNGAGKHASHTDLFYALRKGSPLSAFAGIDLMKVAELYDYTPEPLQAFKFYPLEAYADAKTIDTISMPFLNGKDTFVSYTYDAGKDKLLRFMKGKEFKDTATDAQIEVQNLVVEYTRVAGAGSGEGDRKVVDVKGSGDAEFIIHGKHLKGTWERPSYDEKTTYKLENGEELTFAPGNTWIEIHPAEAEAKVTYGGDSAE